MKTARKNKNYKTLKVPRETVVGLWDLPYEGNSDEGVEIVEDTITDTSRWSIHHRLIVCIQGTYYRTNYSEGATELQEEDPWGAYPEVSFIELKPMQKIITVYEEVLEGE